LHGNGCVDKPRDTPPTILRCRRNCVGRDRWCGRSSRSPVSSACSSLLVRGGRGHRPPSAAPGSPGASPLRYWRAG
jgi:hypothetical protein